MASLNVLVARCVWRGDNQVKRQIQMSSTCNRHRCTRFEWLLSRMWLNLQLCYHMNTNYVGDRNSRLQSASIPQLGENSLIFEVIVFSFRYRNFTTELFCKIIFFPLLLYMFLYADLQLCDNIVNNLIYSNHVSDKAFDLWHKSSRRG